MQYIDTKEMKKSEGNILGNILYDSIKNYFDDPAHKKEFEIWEREQRGQRRKQEL